MSIVTFEKHDHIAIVTIDRPDALNALGRDGDGDSFRDCCDRINRDDDLRCIILTGAGKAFSAGGDIHAMKERSGAFQPHLVALREGYRRNIHLIVRAIHGLEIPCIAAVNGAAIGLGCDVACMADIRISSDRAVYGATFLKLGLIPGDGGAWLLPRVVGMSRASELLFTAKTINAQTALEWGLVSKVVPHADLLAEAMTMAREIAAQPPHALRLAKSLLRQGTTASYDTIMEMSAVSQALSHLTDDHMEGIAALIDKRLPDFKGS